MKKETRGGKREGSGRPKGNPTKTLAYRVPLKLAGKIDKVIRKIIADIKKAPEPTGASLISPIS